MSEPFLVHAHIPKTGGSALNRRLVFPGFGEDRVCQLYRFVFERAQRLPTRHVSRAMRSSAAAGHVPFGYFERLYPGALYVSVFREPESRFLSLLNFVLANPQHKIHERLPAGLTPDQDPDGFVNAILDDPRLSVVQSNAQTRLAAGMARLGDSAVSRVHLEIALANLDSPSYLAGDQADLNGFIAELSARVLLPRPLPAEPPASDARLEKRLPHRITLGTLATRTRDRIASANALDLWLYEKVRRKTAAQTRAAA